MATKSVYTERYSALLALIISARHDADLTQQDLANKLRKPQSYVSKYERGERRLDVVEFLDIADALSASPMGILQELYALQNKSGGTS